MSEPIRRVPIEVKKTSIVTFKTSEDSKREIKRTAAKNRLTVSQLVRAAVRRYIDQLKE